MRRSCAATEFALPILFFRFPLYLSFPLPLYSYTPRLISFSFIQLRRACDYSLPHYDMHISCAIHHLFIFDLSFYYPLAVLCVIACLTTPFSLIIAFVFIFFFVPQEKNSSGYRNEVHILSLVTPFSVAACSYQTFLHPLLHPMRS